jgi:NADH-quinone oxidoreductase subunit J
MNYVFYISAAAACLATLMVITRAHAVHALLYLVVSLLAVAMTFFSLGAPFAAAMEVIVYAGAILVLFVFVIFLLDLRGPAAHQEGLLLGPAVWIVPAGLGLLLLGLWGYALSQPPFPTALADGTAPHQVAAAMFGPYSLAVELASLLLLAALVGAVHLARTDRKEPPR